MSGVLLSQLSISSVTESQFFMYALPWLLTFAISYGILEQIKMPKSKQARAVISIVLAFFVMPIAGPVMGFLESTSASLVVVAMVAIFFLILTELTGTRKKTITKYPRTVAIIVGIIAIMIFWGSGGFEKAGLTNVIPMVNWTTVFFLTVLALAIIWMVKWGD
ncbi:MAG: hypothetical protein ACLFS3_03185 [Candidatus Aenigmatarchaeota archaeon]